MSTDKTEDLLEQIRVLSISNAYTNTISNTNPEDVVNGAEDSTTTQNQTVISSEVCT